MTDTTWLTEEAFDRLTVELNELKGPKRAEIAKRIEEARAEGDLKENGAYHAAKDEQGEVEARVRHLEDLLRTAVVGEAPPDDGVVEPGMLVQATVNGKAYSFLLGNREMAEKGLQVYSENSPLGEAIVGKRQGESTSYVAPNGKSIPVEIISAKPYKP